MAISQNFPSIAPSLSLNFASSRTLDPRITFTRTSSATCVGPNGLLRVVSANEPRFDHDPTTGESLGLLVEEQRTNLLLRSEDFGNAVWSYSEASASTNTTVAPDGTTSGDTVTSAGSAVVSQPIAKTASAITYFSSLFVKGTVTAFTFSIDDGTTTNRGRVVFNLSTGTISSTNNDGEFTGTSGTITSFPNNWYRLTATTTTNSTVVARMRLFWTGAGTSLDFWGAQLEAGAFATSYIPTTTAAVTRAADVASITGSNFSSWYNQTEGTVFAETRAAGATNNGGTSGGAACFSNGTNTERIRVSIAAIQTIWISGNTTQASLNSGAGFVANASFRAAAATKANDFAFTINANTVQSSLSGSAPSVSQLSIGTSNTTAGFLNGTIKRLTFWPQRLPDSTLQTLTK